MDDHLGYGKHDPAGRNGGNSRNGTRDKTVLTEAGPVQIAVPRDRDASFCPQLVRKRQRRLSGVDDLVASLSAKGLTHGEISAHLAEVYGAEVSKQTISAITDRVLEGMAEATCRLSLVRTANRRHFLPAGSDNGQHEAVNSDREFRSTRTRRIRAVRRPRPADRTW